MAEYAGKLHSIEPSKPDGYRVDEYVSLNVTYDAERHNGLGAVFTWHTKFFVKDETGKLLKEHTEYHRVFQPWEDPQIVETETIEIENVVRQPEGGLKGVVEMTNGG